MFTRLTRQTHEYCVKCAKNLSNYGQKNCHGCLANLEKEESRTYDIDLVKKIRNEKEKFIISKL